ncbi:hypothetical protein OVA07_16570 [Novosphingobium sp. SL115]|nr:hypothetical protein [Novosphingobium sp. SL115]MCY1672613.1 hypothetical protein [Novosphingobium sp. SL115]
MNKHLEGSCGDAAIALGLSPLATLALRVSLMILTRIIYVKEGQSLAVNIGYASASIRVSKVRRSSSTRSRKTKCTDEAGSGSMATTPGLTAVGQPAVLSSDGMIEHGSDVKSAATMLALY